MRLALKRPHIAATPIEELTGYLQGLAPSTVHPNNPLAQGMIPSANPSNPMMNPHNPNAFTNPSNPNLNPNLPGAISNPSNPQFNPSLPGAQNNPSNPIRNPSLPTSLTNPSNLQFNPNMPGAMTNPSNPINNPDLPTPAEYPQPQGVSPDASLPPSRWSSWWEKTAAIPSPEHLMQSYPTRYHDFPSSNMGHAGRWPVIWHNNMVHIGPEAETHNELAWYLDELGLLNDDVPRWEEFSGERKPTHPSAWGEGSAAGWIGPNPEAGWHFGLPEDKEEYEANGQSYGWYKGFQNVPPEVNHAIQRYDQWFLTPRLDPEQATGMGHALKFAKETPNQEYKRWQALNHALSEAHRPKSEIIHQFDDGWTVQHHPTYLDVNRVGQFMRNCWQGVTPEIYRRHHDIGEAYYALHDPHGMPRAAFMYHAAPDPHERRTYALPENAVGIFQPLGMRNATLFPEDAQRLQAWTQAQGLEPYVMHGGAWAPLTRPTVLENWFAGDDYFDQKNQRERLQEMFGIPQRVTLGDPIPAGSLEGIPGLGQRQADNFTNDSREWPDPTNPRPSKGPSQEGCTCHEGLKLECPIHGLYPIAPDLDHSWSVEQANPVGFPQDAPRAWTQAVSRTADYLHVAGGPEVYGPWPKSGQNITCQLTD